MIALQDDPRKHPLPEDWHEPFLAMRPKIESYLQVAFRGWGRDAREEAVQEGLVNSLFAFRRLCERGLMNLAYPTVLAKFAARQIREGRRAAEKRNVQ